MILDIYLFLIALSSFFVALGYYLKGEADIFKFIGFTFIFILGLMMVPYNPFGTIEYQSGNNITTVGTSTTVDYNYVDYNNLRLGIYLATLGGLGFASSFIVWRKNDNEEE
jgi:hypothetical protein